jgi:hypothetical protein
MTDEEKLFDERRRLSDVADAALSRGDVSAYLDAKTAAWRLWRKRQQRG